MVTDLLKIKQLLMLINLQTPPNDSLAKLHLAMVTTEIPTSMHKNALLNCTILDKPFSIEAQCKFKT